MICLPLDSLKSLDEGIKRIEELSCVVGSFKIGKESFTRFDREILEAVENNDADVFLDLKYHDIPATVKGASDAAVERAIWMFNVHASGGREMMKAAVEGRNKAVEKYGIARPLTIGVTVLTSIGAAEYLDINSPLVPGISKEELRGYLGMKTNEKEKQERFARMLIEKGYGHLTINDYRGLRSDVVEQEVLNLALMANESCLDGIVCSAADLYAVRPHLPNTFVYTTPGIEGTRTKAGDDQNRVFSPGNAVRDGSKILVVGRAITDAGNVYEKQGDKKVLVKHGTSKDRIQAGYDIIRDMIPYLAA